MGCAAGPHGLPSPRAHVTQLQAITWELNLSCQRKMSFSLVTHQVLSHCLFQHHPAFLLGRQGCRSHRGGHSFGVGSSVLIEPVMPEGGTKNLEMSKF